MDLELAFDQPQFRGPDKLRMRDGHPKQLAFELRGPKIEKRFELRKPRCAVVLLPDIALQK